MVIAPLKSTLGPVRSVRTRTESFPQMTKSFTELAQVVRETGLLRSSPWFYALLGAGLLFILGGLVVASVFIGESWWQLGIAAALALVLTQVAFMAHEAGHRAIVRSGRSSDLLARILATGVVGMSFSWWTSKHSRHHGNPNQIGRDPDIAVDTISFVEEDAIQARGLRAFITRHQGWWFFPLLTLEGINLHVLSVRHLISREPVTRRWLELGLLTARAAIILVPLFIWLSPGIAFAFLGVQLAVFGVYMGASFAPNHKGMPIVEHDARLDFFTKQVRTSRNIRGGWWATWLFGGLNYQVEHHLFPNMSRLHLAKTREIVREYCARLNVPYTETTMWRSYAIVVAYLNRVGLAARDPFDCPIVVRYRSFS